jgi:hypothetical protein
MSDWDDIPEKHHAKTDNDKMVLDLMIKRIREAVRMRHDFQNLAGEAAGERRLRKPALRSEFARGSSKPSMDSLARAHDIMLKAVGDLLPLLDNVELRQLIKDTAIRLFPPIGMDPANPKSGVLRRLRGPVSVLDTILPNRGDTLVRVLLKKEVINVDSTSDPYGKYYF